MFEEYKLITGVLFVLGGLIYLYTLFKRRSPIQGNCWDKSMWFAGMVGGICLILIGIVDILIHFGMW